MGQLDGGSTPVTGASSGIGLAIGRRFAAEGATVYLTGRREAELDAAAAQVGARGIAVRGGTSDLGDLDRLFAEIARRSGRLDVVVANAGVGDHSPLGAITEEERDHRGGARSPRRSTTAPPRSTSRARSSPSRRRCRC